MAYRLFVFDLRIQSAGTGMEIYSEVIRDGALKGYLYEKFDLFNFNCDIRFACPAD